MKKALFIGLVWPEPTSSAAGWRILQLIRLFQQDYAVHFACAAAKSEYSHKLSDWDVIEQEIALNDSSFDEYIQALQPDIVVFDRFMIEEQYGWRVAQHCPQAVRILDTEDLHFLRSARLKGHKTDESPNIYNETTWRELASIFRSDLSLIISEAEMTLLNDTFHVESYLLHYIPFIEDEITDQHIRSLSPYSERKDFVFIGNFIHEPNWKTVEVLKKTIWPRLKKELPQAELHIYGAYAPQKALQLHKPTEGFFIKGRAEDARLALEKYRVLLAPIPVGAGIKGKFVDAMYSGIPSVSSTIGAEGMTKNGLWNGCITDDADDFVRKSTRLYNSEEEWTSAQHIGFDLFNSSFTSKDYASDLLRMCRQLLENLHIHRQNNFIGQMLNHHSLQSAKYMSLWIEAKNKNARQT